MQPIHNSRSTHSSLSKILPLASLSAVRRDFSNCLKRKRYSPCSFIRSDLFSSTSGLSAFNTCAGTAVVGWSQHAQTVLNIKCKCSPASTEAPHTCNNDKMPGANGQMIVYGHFIGIFSKYTYVRTYVNVLTIGDDDG